MELKFAKTAPGVMTASWTHPKKGRQYSIAIIESCDTQHLFIDGELIARELPTFDDAVTLAKQKLSSTQSSGLVRIAGGLVAASVIGASVVVASQFMPSISPAEIAAAASSATTAIDTETQTPQTASKPVTAEPRNSEVPTQPKIAIEAPVSITPAPQKVEKPKQIAITVSPPAAQPAETVDAEPLSDTETSGRRRFSARNNLLALEAHLAKERTAADAESNEPGPASATLANGSDVSQAEPKQPATSKTSVALAPTAPPALAATPAANTPAQNDEKSDAAPTPVPAHATPDVSPSTPLIRPMVPQKADVNGLEVTPMAPQTASRPESPPLPAKSPAIIVPPVKLVAHTPKFKAATPATRQTRTAKPKAKRNRSRSSRVSRRRTRPSSRRLPQRTRTAPSRRVVKAGPQKRLVCFAHVCRWR